MNIGIITCACVQCNTLYQNGHSKEYKLHVGTIHMDAKLKAVQRKMFKAVNKKVELP